MKNSNDTIWDRTSDLPICSIAHHPLCHRGPQRGKTHSKPFTARHGRGTACYVCIGLKRAKKILSFYITQSFSTAITTASQSLVTIRIQINPLIIVTTYLFTIHFNIIFLCKSTSRKRCLAQFFRYNFLGSSNLLYDCYMSSPPKTF